VVTHLNIFSGIGGMDIGLEIAMPGLVTVGYCERDAYAASVILARMANEELGNAPVFCGDIADLDATAFAGVDILSSSPPCQPYSQAGKRKGNTDERSHDAVTAMDQVRSSILCELSTSVDRALSSLRMSRLGSQQDIFSQSETPYTTWITESKDRSFLLRVMLARRTDGSGFLSWPTPDTQDRNVKPHQFRADTNFDGMNGRHSISLGQVAASWPTARAEDAESFGNHPGKMDSLTGIAKAWPGPSLSHAVQTGVFSHHRQTDNGTTSTNGSCRRLNPAFAAWLMGLPWWWTRTDRISSAASGTQSYLSKSRSHLLSLLARNGNDATRDSHNITGGQHGRMGLI
jgi:hypothetical protein